VVLHCGTNTLEATPEHPLWVADQGWKAAGQLQVGDELWTRSGERVAVTDIRHKQGQFTVYNFEVEDFHSYFAGKQQALAHNRCEFFNIKSLFGKTQRKVLSEAPPTWKKLPANRGNGWKLVDENGVERVRFMRPEPDAINFQHERTGYWRWKNADDEWLDESGKVVHASDPDFHRKTHIPYSGAD